MMIVMMRCFVEMMRLSPPKLEGRRSLLPSLMEKVSFFSFLNSFQHLMYNNAKIYYTPLHHTPLEMVPKWNGEMVSKNRSEGAKKWIAETGGNNVHKRHATRKKDGNQVPQLLLALALCSLIGYVQRRDVYVRYVEESAEDLELLSLNERVDRANGGKCCIVKGCGKRAQGTSYDYMCKLHFGQRQRSNNGEPRLKLVICEQGDADSFLMQGLEISRMSRVAERLEATEMVHLNGHEDHKHPKVSCLVYRLKQDFNFAMVQGSVRGYNDDMKFIFVHELFTTVESIAKIAHGNIENKKWLRTSK